MTGSLETGTLPSKGVVLVSAHGPPKHLHWSGVGAGFGVLVAVALALVSALLVGHARSATPPSGLIAFTRPDGVYVMRADGRGVRPLRRGGVAARAAGLAWSPDGRKLAFLGGAWISRRAIWVMKADGSGLVRLVATENSALEYLGEPTWSPRGDRVAFVATTRDERKTDIWIVNADGSNLRRLVSKPSMEEWDVDWSPVGDRLVVTDVNLGWPLLRVMNLDGSNVRTLTPGWASLADQPGRAYQAATPQWSPDGRRIAFTGWQVIRKLDLSEVVDVRTAEIWVVNANGRSRVRLTRNNVKDSYPAWSPDGSKIAFVQGGGTRPIGARPGNTNEIYVMNADGTGVTQLTHNRLAEGSPAWQPLGAH
jgi:TolB protein